MNQTRFFIAFFALALFSACGEKDPISSVCDEKCAQAPDAGLCNAAFKRYYFDKVEKKCKEFTWGGCGGVVPFETLEECENCGCN